MMKYRFIFFDVDSTLVTIEGIDVAVVTTGSSSSEQLRAANADHYLDRFSDLLRIVQS